MLNYILLISYLMLARPQNHVFRISVFLAIVTSSILSVQTSRTLGLAYGNLVGVSGSWCITVSINSLFICQPFRDHKRIKELDKRSRQDTCSKINSNNEAQWQSMPVSTYERLFWILDLLGSLRVLHWSFGESGSCGYTAKPILESKGPPSLWASLFKILLIYVCVDGLKEIIAMDPYFWGFVDSGTPDYLQSYLPGQSLVQAYRMLICFAVLYLAIELISTFGVLLFVHILGPSLAGTWGNKRAYRPQFGDIGSICKKGLQGWWGAWWHQMFRSTLVMPANAVINKLGLKSQSAGARTIRLLVPFSISGIIHATGSYTMWGNTRPRNVLLFFLMQPLGIGLQILGSYILHRQRFILKILPHTREVANVAFTVLWLLKTFPLLADDFARGGLWLTEPFPISIFQALGIGNVSRSQQMGFDYSIRSQLGQRWWQLGVAL